MGRVAVVADSHDNLKAIESFLKEIREQNIDTIIHAGDIISPFALKRFSGYKIYAVFGNNDGEKIILTKVAYDNGFRISEQPLIFSLGQYRIALIHGVSGKEETKTLVEALAKSAVFDLVIYGHLHEIDIRKVGETYILNPGELCGYLTGRSTYAIVDLERKHVEIIEV